MTAPVADYDIPAVATILGKSEARVRDMARAGQIPGAYQLARRGHWRIRRRDFDQWHAGLAPKTLDPHRLEPPSRRSISHRNRRAS